MEKNPTGLALSNTHQLELSRSVVVRASPFISVVCRFRLHGKAFGKFFSDSPFQIIFSGFCGVLL